MLRVKGSTGVDKGGDLYGYLTTLLDVVLGDGYDEFTLEPGKGDSLRFTTDKRVVGTEPFKQVFGSYYYYGYGEQQADGVFSASISIRWEHLDGGNNGATVATAYGNTIRFADGRQRNF